jgi:hypothetical protein
MPRNQSYKVDLDITLLSSIDEELDMVSSQLGWEETCMAAHRGNTGTVSPAA